MVVILYICSYAAHVFDELFLFFFTCSKTYMNCVELFRESLLARLGLTCVIHWPMNPHYTQHKSLFHCLWHRSIIHSLVVPDMVVVCSFWQTTDLKGVCLLMNCLFVFLV